MTCFPTRQTLPRRAQAGFTLIEALVSLLVVSFGMLAIAGMQTTLARNSDLAKQRTEAVRLAQFKMEELRAFDSIVSGTGTWNYATDVVSGADAAFTPTNSNTAFTRSWTVTGLDGSTAAGANDAQKWIHVTVQWADRSSTTLNQSIKLDSNIARNNPTALKSLVAGQAQPKVRTPKNRNLNIPYPAVTLSDGKHSAFAPPPGAVAYVFDNVSGNIVSSCPIPTATITSLSRSGSTVTVTTISHTFVAGNKVAITGVSDVAFNGTFTVVSASSSTTFTYTSPAPLPLATSATGGTAIYQLVEGLNLSSSGLTCTALDAYLLSGYVRFSAATDAGILAKAAENSIEATRDLDGAVPLSVYASATGNGPAAFSCFAQRQIVVSTSNVNPSTIATISRTNGTVTLTTSGAHGFPVSARIATEGLSDFSFEGSFDIVSVPSSTTLTYLQPGADAGPITGTAASKIKLIQQITLTASEPVPTAYNKTESSFVSYACVVTPVDDDSNPLTPNAWWGQVNLNPSGWTIGTTSVPLTYQVCRYSGDYGGASGADTVSNAEHPRYYRRVTGALDSQNFFVIPGTALCPGDVPVDFNSGGNSVSFLLNANTVPHQPSAESSYQCLSVNNANQCSGGNKQPIESSTATVVAPMF